jgi:hypothetical protein
MGLSALPSATWVGINERFEQAHVHAHINLIGLCLDGAVRPALPRLPGSCDQPFGRRFNLLSSISALWCVLVSIPLAQAHQTVALAAGGSLTVLAGMLTFLANYLLNVFSKSKSSART